ncbi:PEPKR2 [Symbiodinium natans]|uniref:PEPKR2 protein n=1 Tax=Symbiodinium natans TaxID=878477 RepID=A0A812P1I3_9DINO|nr:PEPKR2 [Symbiodinium natans]
MSEVAVPSGFRWLWLHQVHTSESEGGTTSSSAPAPWTLPQSEEAAFKLRGRHECLGNLLQRAAAGSALSTARQPPLETTEFGFPGPSEEGPVLFFSEGRLQGSNATGEITVSVPLLMADLVYLTAKSPDSERSWYLLVLAPRPCPQKPVEDEHPATESGDMMPLKDVWLLYTAPVEHSDFLRLLFEFGGRGALRWDLHECYAVTEKSLGVGGCGTVYLGQSRMRLPTPKDSAKVDIPAVPQVAVKKLNKSGGVTEEINIRSEIEFLAVARGHPCISALFGVFCFHEVGAAEGKRGPSIRWTIVMPLYSEGDLFDYLAANGAMKETAAVTLMLCLLSALTHLHRLGVVHRDVKAENILLANNKAVLSDVGIAAFLKDDEAMQRRVGSPGYAPPEVVTDLPYDEKVDVFGAGAVLFFALSNTLPFPGKTLKKVLELTARCKVKYDPALFGEFSGSIIQLLKALLQKDPAKRPSARKSFKALWTMASQKPEIARSNVARMTLQAVDDFDSLVVTGLESMKRESRESSGKPGLEKKVMRTTSDHVVPKKSDALAPPAPETSAQAPRKPSKESKGASPTAEKKPTVEEQGPSTSPKDKAELVPTPPSGPRPTSSGGTFSFLKNRFGWSKSSGGGGENSQGLKE